MRFRGVELDGATHLERRQVIKDRGRNNAGVLSGFPVLRYGYADVVHHPDKVMAEVWQAVGPAQTRGISAAGRGQDRAG